mmetsp:Transcript_22711/g.68386  ORF Transcript_22711/g.68386 Transcript_22711/m.68386 type:complete len:144 (-) Transcript_22711:70-501(-)
MGDLDTASIVAKGEEYGRLSNLHDIDGITSLLHPTAELYGFKGVAAIDAGIRQFRRNFPRVWWRFPTGFRPVPDRAAVHFAFDRFWTDSATGTVQVCSAVEEIQFDVPTLTITAIVYVEKPTEAAPAPGNTYPGGAHPLDFVE